jgi:hypothetical protein
MSLFDIFNNSVAKDAAAQQVSGIQQGVATADPLLQQGLTQANQTYAGALAPFTSNLQTTQGGQQGYADATGVNGPQGNQRAVQNFQTGPGYQFALDQGSQNLLRNSSQTGSATPGGSGGLDLALQKQGQGMADQNWQQYISNLLPFVGASTANAGGAAGVGVNQANLQNSNAGSRAQLAYTADTGIGNANANATLAQNQANSNQMSGLLQAGKLGAGLLAYL